jgi:hypothetical protein
VSRGEQKAEQSGGSSVTDLEEPQGKNHGDYLNIQSIKLGYSGVQCALRPPGAAI